jgi:hypothetical protein
MTTTNEKQINATVKDARDGWCNSCDMDMDLAQHPDYAAEAARRPRLHLEIKESLIRLCPDCAKTIRAELFDFSA